MDDLEEIANIHGYDAQSRQCIEEMAELTQAINKLWRNRLDLPLITVDDVNRQSPEFINLKEEIADVQIMLWQMEKLLKLGNEEMKEVIKKKIDREKSRIESM
jgi:NTP pyrophosphatase (non-canonical NTP hydrolase)